VRDDPPGYRDTRGLVAKGQGGGPGGVGEAVGRSMRFSLISLVVVVPLFATLALYSVNPNFALTV
jgi:phospholipid/cholesterol/gamma-HCH transport system permease protein